MDFKIFPLLILSWVSARPSVDRYITELPSQWDYDMVADQPYVPASASSYIYQIDDPSANYIYSSKFWHKKDHTSTSYTRRSGGSDTSTPTRRPESAYSYYASMPPFEVAVPQAQVTYTPVVHRTPPWYPFNYGYNSVGNVYTTPYEFSGTASTFVRPNVLYSTYSTYSKPVYVVNNPYNGYSIPSYVYIYENPKQYVFSYHQQPVHGDGDATKIQNNTGTACAGVNIPTKIQKAPIRTNLTEINIDPITEARYAFDGAARTTRINLDSNIIHKQRPSYYNTYDIIHHKFQSTDRN